MRLQCLSSLHSPPPRRLSRPPLPFLQEALEVLVTQGLATRASGMLSGWMANLPLRPNVSYAGNRFIASLA